MGRDEVGYQIESSPVFLGIEGHSRFVAEQPYLGGQRPSNHKSSMSITYIWDVTSYVGIEGQVWARGTRSRAVRSFWALKGIPASSPNSRTRHSQYFRYLFPAV